MIPEHVADARDAEKYIGKAAVEFMKSHNQRYDE